MFVASSIQGPHLHDGEGDAAEADGRLEGGHGLGVGQPVQTGLIHPQQQVSLLKTRGEPIINNAADTLSLRERICQHF